MKRLWIAAALLFCLLSVTLVNARYAQGLTDRLAQQLEQAQRLAHSDRWTEAEQLTHQVYTQWESSHFYLHTVMRHADTDEILRAFQAVLEYLDIQELDQYAAANVDLIVRLQLLAEMEQASLVNVL